MSPQIWPQGHAETAPASLVARAAHNFRRVRASTQAEYWIRAVLRHHHQAGHQCHHVFLETTLVPRDPASFADTPRALVQKQSGSHARQAPENHGEWPSQAGDCEKRDCSPTSATIAAGEALRPSRYPRHQPSRPRPFHGKTELETQSSGHCLPQVGKADRLAQHFVLSRAQGAKGPPHRSHQQVSGQHKRLASTQRKRFCRHHDSATRDSHRRA